MCDTVKIIGARSGTQWHVPHSVLCHCCFDRGTLAAPVTVVLRRASVSAFACSKAGVSSSILISQFTSQL